MPSIAIVHAYEAVYILDPDFGEEQITAVTAKYRQLVESNGGTAGKIDVWERRKLAYPIKGRTEGIYVVMLFSGKPAVEAELRRVFQISEDQLRYLIVKLEGDDITAPSEPSAGSVRSAPPAPAVEPAATLPAVEPAATLPAAEPAATATETPAAGGAGTEPAEPAMTTTAA